MPAIVEKSEKDLVCLLLGKLKGIDAYAVTGATLGWVLSCPVKNTLLGYLDAKNNVK